MYGDFSGSISNDIFSFKWYNKYEDKVLPCLSNLKELLTPPPKAFSITKLSALSFGNSYLVTFVAPKWLKISNIELPITKQIKGFYTKLIKKGYSKEDTSNLIRLLR